VLDEEFSVGLFRLVGVSLASGPDKAG